MKLTKEGFNPFNLNKPNPLADIDVTKICYFDTETTGINPKLRNLAAAGNYEKFKKGMASGVPEILKLKTYKQIRKVLGVE
jgi:uncharacterized protein YprB with RNaseH-like and TPR domain